MSSESNNDNIELCFSIRDMLEMYHMDNYRKMDVIRFISYDTDEKIEKHIAKLKTLDAIRVANIDKLPGKTMVAINYMNNSVDIIAKCKSLSIFDTRDDISFVYNILSGKDADTIGFLFNDLNCNILDLSGIDFSSNKNLNYSFSGSDANEIDFGNADLSNITSLEGTFYNCKSLESINISNIIPPKVINIDCIFAGVNRGLFRGLDLTALDNTEILSTIGVFRNITCSVDDLQSIRTNNPILIDLIQKKINQLQKQK